MSDRKTKADERQSCLHRKDRLSRAAPPFGGLRQHSVSWAELRLSLHKLLRLEKFGTFPAQKPLIQFEKFWRDKTFLSLKRVKFGT
jgi:hypothetical protein